MTPGEDQPSGWRLVLDQSITRRKLYHIVCDPTGAPVYRSMFVSECIAWLDASGIEEYEAEPSPVRALGATPGRYRIRKL